MFDDLPRGCFWLVRLPRRALIVLVRVYRLLLSPWLGNSCRFEPTCSCYAIEALERHGALLGSGLAAGRVLRCHPWCTPGHDPVPEHPWRLFTDLLVDGGPAVVNARSHLA